MAETKDPGLPNAASTDLWKFFEQRGAEQKESMYRFVTWIVGFAAAVLALAVKDGFEEGFERIAHPRLLFIFGFAGLVMVSLAFFIVRDHGRHINRTLARADAARDGQSAPRKIWEAGKEAEGGSLPRICKELLFVVGTLAVCFALLMFFGAVGLFGPPLALALAALTAVVVVTVKKRVKSWMP
jgi:hypothetical protein